MVHNTKTKFVDTLTDLKNCNEQSRKLKLINQFEFLQFIYEFEEENFLACSLQTFPHPVYGRGERVH
jgi:hypothetical protein